MTSSESVQHRKIKEVICQKLREWTGATLPEYQSSGHELDVFAVTSNGISICAEIIWTSTRSNFFRDMTLIQASDADVKLVIVSPKILRNDKYRRAFEKVAISQRRLNFAMYGEFIDGEKIITNPNYLEIEFKNMILDLLKHVQIRGKAVGIRAKFEPPKPTPADEIDEQLSSNLFPVEKYPSTIFVSPTNFTSATAIYRECGDRIKPYPFLLKRRKLYTFNDLRKTSSPFSGIISKDEITMEKVSDWMQDDSKRNDLMYLFNLSLMKYCRRRGVDHDKAHQRFVCRLRRGQTSRFFTWRRKMRVTPRVIAQCMKDKDGNTLFCKHYAARLRFMMIDNNIFLRISPTITFTSDGYHPFRSPKLASLMSRYVSKQYNSEYLDLVRFWGKFLSKLDALISIPTGETTIEIDSSPLLTPVGVGIAEEREA